MSSISMQPGRLAFPIAGAPASLVLPVLAAVILLAAAGFAVGGELNVAPRAEVGAYDSVAAAAAEIVGRNALAAAALLAGVVTFGVFSGVFLLVISLFFGVMSRTAMEVMGPEWLFRYVPFATVEMLGFTLIAVAGLLPLTQSLRVGTAHRFLPTYFSAIRNSTKPLLWGACLLGIAAIIELIWGVTYS